MWGEHILQAGLSSGSIYIYKYIYIYGRCNLCLGEKIQIILYPDPGNLLNQRCDLIARCQHKNKFRLFSKY